MLLEIVKYGDPVLRQKGAKIDKITPEIQQLVQDMIATMYAAHGVGLAAQQIGKALQVCVIDVKGVTDRPSTMAINEEPVDLEQFMPMVLINPEFKPLGDSVAGPEGCLSFPEIYSDIVRPETIEVSALNESGESLQFRCGGLLARAIQHEYDHLQGILFIDRMARKDKEELKPEIEALQRETRERLQKRR
ncbi:MAG: peptide deformylase [Verrucomicrobiota bacterium]|nr:peptide deformylase [Verrucomicrobiota bacterium]